LPSSGRFGEDRLDGRGDIASKKKKKQVRQQDTKFTVKTMCNTVAPLSRDSNIYVAVCIPLSSVLKSVKINGMVTD